jgi:glycosyltransferase involved in cell wall biosynthesis
VIRKTFYTEFAGHTEDTEKRKFHSPFSANSAKGAARRGGHNPIIAVLTACEKIDSNKEQQPRAGIAFTQRRVHRYNLSTSMAHQRYNASALHDPKVSIVIPVYNEKSTIDEILRRVLDTKVRKEVIIVDDCSTDGTRQILENMAARQANGDAFAPAQDGSDQIELRDLRFFFQTPNQGKGAALRCGFAQVTGEIVLVQDADLEYDPRDYGVLLEPIVEGRADVVYGSRFLGGPQRVHYFWHYVANRMLTLLSDIFTNLKLTDMETCYKVFRKEVLAGVQLKSDRFGFEPEITAKIAKHNWRIYEVPITYAGRTYEEGKKITWKDGIQALWCIIRYKFSD